MEHETQAWQTLRQGLVNDLSQLYEAAILARPELNALHDEFAAQWVVWNENAANLLAEHYDQFIAPQMVEGDVEPCSEFVEHNRHSFVTAARHSISEKYSRIGEEAMNQKIRDMEQRAQRLNAQAEQPLATWLERHGAQAGVQSKGTPKR